MKKILITGATGQLGRAVVQSLTKQLPAHQIAVITRQEEQQLQLRQEGFSAFVADYDDVASLRRAMEGVAAVLLIAAGDAGNRMQQHWNVIDAAKQMGVSAIAYTSRSLKDQNTLSNALMQDHFETEDYIKASGLAYTLFRNALYMDALPIFIGKDLPLHGIALPAGNGKVAFVMRSDLGEAIGNVLATGVFENKTYQFTGSQAYSFYDVAAALSDGSGHNISYVPVSAAAFSNRLKEKSIPEPALKKILDFIADIKAGQEAQVTMDLEAVLNRKPTSLHEGIKALYQL
jgi:NAD(P)H dehydrogenase (quinone)